MKRILNISLLILLLIYGARISAQSNLIYTQEELLRSGDIDLEIQEFKAKMVKDKKNPNLYLGLGYCYLLSPDSKHKAMDEVKKAVELLEPKKSTAETDYLKAQILLGQAWRLNMLFDQAKAHFESIAPLMKEKTLSEFVKRELILCDNGIAAIMNPKYVSVSNMHDFNSHYSDHSPMMINNNSVIFTAKLKSSIGDKKEYAGEYAEDVYISSLKAEGTWTKPEPMDKNLKKKDNISNCGLSPDRNTVYFYYNGDIHESILKKGKWSKLKKTNIPVNSPSEEKHISFTADGNTAYFASDRPGGAGGYDIYVIKKDGANWGKPALLGKEINTPYDDHSPNITPEGILYFSSKGHNSMGGYDIFMALPADDGKFQQPENLGFPTNSVDDDIFYFPSEDGHRAFFTSNRSFGRGSADIYMVNYMDFLMVQGNTIKKGGEVSGIKNQIFKLEDKGLYDATKLNPTGDYSLLANRSTNYYTTAQATGYYFETFAFTTLGDLETEQKIQNIVLQPIPDKDAFKQYEPPCTNFDNQMVLFLNTLVDFLKENPRLFADISFEDDALTQQAVDYLKEYGVSEKQISIYAHKKENCTVTIYDKKNEKTVVISEPIAETFETYKPSTAPSKTIYTIQCAAFRRNLDINHWYFKEKRGQLMKRDGIDGLHRYTEGVYNSLEEAQKALPKYQAIFWDAFIREINWYDQLNSGTLVQ